MNNVKVAEIAQSNLGLSRCNFFLTELFKKNYLQCATGGLAMCISFDLCNELPAAQSMKIMDSINSSDNCDEWRMSAWRVMGINQQNVIKEVLVEMQHVI